MNNGPVRRTSRSAALRSAKNVLAITGTQQPGFDLSSAEAPDEVKEALAKYTPRGVPTEKWLEYQELVFRLTVTYGAKSSYIAQVIARTVLNFLFWFQFSYLRPNPGEPVTFEEVAALNPSVADAWINSEPSFAPKWQSTVRSRMRRVLTNAQGIPQVKIPRRYVSDSPYTAAEIVMLRRMVTHQSTPARQRIALLLFALALGGGLDGHDLRYIKGTDINLESNPVTVTPASNKFRKSRTIPLRADVAEMLVKGLELLAANGWDGKDYLFPRGDNSVSNTVGRLQNNTGIEFSLYRLRLTWLVSLMETRPIREVLYLAGLTSPSTIEEMLHFFPVPPVIDQTMISQTELIKEF